MENTSTLGTQQLIELITAAATARELDIHGVPHVILPNGLKVESFEKLLPAPRRTTRKINAHDIAGFTEYVNDFKSEQLAMFCTEAKSPSLLAILDDHKPGEPSHATHTCSFPCPRTEEWTRWTANDKKALDQVAFAEFIEANQTDIVEPAAGDLLKAVLDFRDSGSYDFRSATRLENGRVQFAFVEKDGNGGQLAFPERLKIGVAVFQGQKKRYALDARLRYRAKEGHLTLWYELDRPDLVVRHAYDELIKDVEAAVGIKVYLAS